MRKSATDVMQDIVAAAVLDAIAALKAASKGLPNNLLRDLNAIHANTTFADLPAEVQNAVSASVRAAFSRLQKEGYSVSGGEPRDAPPAEAGSGSAGGPAPPLPPSAAQARRLGPGRPPGKGGGGGGRPPPAQSDVPLRSDRR